jgi:hypothetical protein
MIGKRIIAAGFGTLLIFTLSAFAASEAQVEAAQRDVEIAKAKADTAEHQAREAKANAEKMKTEKASGNASKSEK